MGRAAAGKGSSGAMKTSLAALAKNGYRRQRCYIQADVVVRIQPGRLYLSNRPVAEATIRELDQLARSVDRSVLT